MKYATFKMLLIIELFMYGYIGTMLIEAVNMVGIHSLDTKDAINFFY